MPTPIRGYDSITADQAVAIIKAASPRDVNPVQTARYVRRMHLQCYKYGLTLRVLLSQAHWETGAFGPEGRWDELNPAGLNITDDSAVTPFRITDGEDAANVHVWSVLVALRDWTAAATLTLKAGFDMWKRIWTKKYESIATPTVVNVEDLNIRYGNNATWAMDVNYHTGILSTMRRLFTIGRVTKEKPVSNSRGKVPKPPYETMYQARINAIAGVNCTEIARGIKGSSHHTEVGSYLGTKGWFLNPYNGAITDFQIGGPWDGPLYDGVIMRFIEEDMPVAPWANGVIGKSRPPFGEAKKFLDKYGYGPTGERLNSDVRSIELSDGAQPDRPRELTGPQIESLCFITAYVHSEEAGQDWEDFANQIQHYESGTDHSGCPGAWLKANRQAVKNRTVAIMKAYQTNTKLDRPLLITYPDGWTGGVIAQPGADAGPIIVDPPKPPVKPESLYPKDMTEALAKRFYGSLKVSWASRPFTFDIKRSECRAWLAFGKSTIGEGENYEAGSWGELTDVIRRGDGHRVFVWSNGFVYEQ